MKANPTPSNANLVTVLKSLLHLYQTEQKPSQTLGGDAVDADLQVVSQKANDSKNDQSGVKRRQNVASCHEERVSEMNANSEDGI